MTLPLPSTSAGTFAEAAADPVLEYLDGCDAFVVLVGRDGVGAAAEAPAKQVAKGDHPARLRPAKRLKARRRVALSDDDGTVG